LDATNVVTSPAVSIITSIGLEHTRILGDTVEEIALEKGGIIKPGRPVLVGPNVPHAVLRQCAKDKGAGTYYTCDEVLGQAVYEALSQNDIEDYDLENARTAQAALKLLQESHPQIIGKIPDDVILKGTSERPPCRFEHVECPNGLTVVLDVAHNPPAMEYLVRKLRKTYPDAKFRIVVGMSSDKDLALCGKFIMDAVGGETDRIHFVQAAHPRAATLEAILEATSWTDAHYDLVERSVSRQIYQAMQLAVEKNETLIVCGSVFLMAEAREALGFDEPRDSAYIAEVAGAGVRHGQENFGNSSVPAV
jgi:dihydrofolate synthase/folylpolyglutamate synthase